MAADPDDDPISLTRDGKKVLRDRFLELKASEQLSLEKVGARIGCSHNMVRALIHDEYTIGLAMDPSWSSPLVPALCRVLGIPLWQVVAGLDEHHQRALEILDRVRAEAPAAIDAFLDAIEDVAAGQIARATKPAEPPKVADGSIRSGEGRPPLRPVK